ncbi:MAG: histidine kinase [Magnetococcales bacterium]|nr:histidine kinase [Magnetococcales bacterium]
MSNRKKYWGLFGFFLVLELAVVAILIWRATTEMPLLTPEITAWLQHHGGILLAALAGLFLVLGQIWSWIDKSLLEPTEALSRDISIMAKADPNRKIQVDSGHWLGALPESVEQLGASLVQARREINEALATGTQGVERLEMVIKRLKVGVIVCDAEARILLYNASIQDLFRNQDQALGLGRSLFGLCARLPVETTMIQLLQQRENPQDNERDEARFFCATTQGELLLDCIMSLLPKQGTDKDMFVMTLSEVTRKMEALQRNDRLIRTSLERFRSPMATIRAAAENLVENPDMPSPTRETFTQIINQEIKGLSELFDSVSREARALASDHWTLTDTHTADLFATLERHLTKKRGPTLLVEGTPLWIQADAPALLLVLEALVENIVATTQVESLTLETLMGDRRVYLDIIWSGDPIPSGVVESWQGLPLQESTGNLTLGDVLERHGGAIWSQVHRTSGQAILRLPVSSSPRQWQLPREEIPERPEFHDFSRTETVRELGRLAASSLANLTFVVFDTETTGLNPSNGDEIISIAGVRIVNGRILQGETFQSLVNPRRTIPRVSIGIHGITDQMVKDAPPIEEVLPRFKEFSTGAVLVAHNAAFDMRFLQLKEELCGVWFDNPVLDTLLLSVYLHDEVTDHTLDGIAGRLGVQIRERHTAMGDAMVTAEVFVRLLELLNVKGISSLGLAVQASESMLQIRKQQAKANY